MDPGVRWLRSYQPSWLRGDAVAGLTAAAVVVPQAMAYAAIAGLPLVVGLYTALVPLVVYAVMGSSRPLSVTTTSTIAILTASALHQVAPNGSNEALIAATGTLACLVGAMLLVASVLRMGVVASFISEPVLIGFKAGVGLTIVVDQIPKLLGVSFLKGHFFHNLVSIVESSAAGVRADDPARAGHAGAATRLAAIPAPRAGVPRHRGHGHRRLVARRTEPLRHRIGWGRQGRPAFVRAAGRVALRADVAGGHRHCPDEFCRDHCRRSGVPGAG